MMEIRIQATPLRHLLFNLKQGVRGTLFMPIAFDAVHATWSQFMGLIAVKVAVAFAWDFVHIGPQGSLSLYGLPGVLFTVPVILFASWALARHARRSDQTLLLAVILSSMVLVIDAYYPLLHSILSYGLGRGNSFWGWLLFYFGTVWFTLAAGVLVLRLFDQTRWKKAAAFLLAVILIALPLTKVYRNQALWQRPFDERAYRAEQRQGHVLESEDVFYLQPKLLERRLAALQPGRKNGINLYFVGVAGYSEQDVFMKEVNYVSQLFKKRYGTEGRSVELINNPKTVEEFPIASVTSLRQSLIRIGELMDKEKDVLFLYLTSHGSQDHKFSLDFGAMQFNDLDPQRLREILEQSGIKRRVVVISACYSGGFIDALKNENTLVITSAAADRTSFGCSSEADFTYFGDAYFSAALRKTNSFIEAFDLAKPAIAKREDEDDYEHSEPSIFIGDNIRATLEIFDNQLPSSGFTQKEGLPLRNAGKI